MVELTHEEQDVENIPSFVFVQRHNTNDWQLLNTNFQVLASWELIRLDRRVHQDPSSQGKSHIILLVSRKESYPTQKKKRKVVAVGLSISGSMTFYPFLWTTAEIWLGEKKSEENFSTSVLDALILPMVTKENAWLLYHFISLPLRTPVSLPHHTKDWSGGTGELRLYLISFRAYLHQSNNWTSERKS